jgi:ubiquitin carboxyl-terminal hydrolase L3
MTDGEEEDIGGWLPLESNPEIVTPFARRVGMPAAFGFCDVYGIDDGLLMMVPQPCTAVILCFPSSDASYAMKESQRAAIEASGQPAAPADLFYLTQHDGFGNACGTIACVHALANSAGLALDASSTLGTFIAAQSGKSADEMGRALLSARDFREVSDVAASSEVASTACPERDERVDSHFISFVRGSDGNVWELDGRKHAAICHGPTTDATSFLKDAVAVIKRDFMDADPGEIRFNMMALSQL